MKRKLIQFKNKLALGYEYLGEKEVKNIVEPVKVYKAKTEPVAKSAVKKAGLGRWRWAVLSVTTVLFIGAGTVAIWNFYFRSSVPSVEPASVEEMKFPLVDTYTYCSAFIRPKVKVCRDRFDSYKCKIL